VTPIDINPARSTDADIAVLHYIVRASQAPISSNGKWLVDGRTYYVRYVNANAFRCPTSTERASTSTPPA
jgi:hypothetical protein